MELRCALLHRLYWIEHKRIFLILYFNRCQSPLCNYLVDRYYRRNIISVIAYPRCKKLFVRDILMCRVRRPRMPRRRELVLWHVKAGHYLNHAVDLLRLARIYPDNPAVCYCRVKYLCNKILLLVKVIGVPCTSGDLVVGIDPFYALSNTHAASFL